LIFAARTESWLARNGQSPAQIKLSPHGRENGRTKRFSSARRAKLSAQIDFEAAGDDFCPHEAGLSLLHPESCLNQAAVTLKNTKPAPNLIRRGWMELN
jgi:hypothetical protein